MLTLDAVIVAYLQMIIRVPNPGSGKNFSM